MSPTEPHAERLRDYFDEHAEDWSRSYQRVTTANDVVLGERLRLALALTADAPPVSRVLDAGCGTGALTVELARRGHSVVAVDVAERMLELCRRALAEARIPTAAVELHRGDVQEIDLGAPFDAVYALGFLQYQADERLALRRLHALLRPGGSLVVSGPIGRRLGNLFGLWDHVARRRGRTAELERLLTLSRHTYSPGRLRRLLAETGFETLRSAPHGFVNYALVGPLLGTRGELVLHRFFTRLSNLLPLGRFANDLVVLAKSTASRVP